MMKIIAAATLVGISGIALAQSPESSSTPPSVGAAPPAGSSAGGQHSFSQLDADRNGYLSKSEVDSDSWAKNKLGSADKDGDGRISQSEYDSAKK